MKKDLFENKKLLGILFLVFRKTRIRICSYLLNLFYYLQLKRIPLLPIGLDIEPTNRCNFRCPHCQLTYWDKPKKDLDFIEFKKIIGQFSNINFIKLQGMGEPLLCEDFVEMLEYGESKAINMEFTTNGSIKSEKFLDLVNKLNRTEIRFSIDGVNEKIYQKIRPRGNLNKILENVSQVVIKRGNNKQPEVTFWMVLTKINFREIKTLISLAKDFKVGRVGIQTTLHDWAKKEMKGVIKNLRIDYKYDIFNNEITIARKLAKSLGVKFEVENNLLSKKKKCRWPFVSAFIAVNGDVIPCCWLADSSTIKMGNVFEQDFSKIWNSVKYQELRESIKKHELNEFCKGCYID